MKLLIVALLFALLPSLSMAQQNRYWEEWNKQQLDSLRSIWNNSANDIFRMAAARSPGWYCEESKLV